MTALPTNRPMPPVVYVPTTDEADQRARRLVMHTVEDGRTAIYTYSAPDRLDRYYLQGQPWVLLDVASLQRAYEDTPYDLLFVDVSPGLQEIDESDREDDRG
ncbi:SAV_915 family protein [Litorihabitans aurantiacus]|uniref:SseB protein N-terminal domain-containing protein n=1 Tax=Litorihabitans aurantiacus TaxID=1930061 RepID=A0AA38CVV6_9MICO|nr:SAV_915 family protein [Litorihabitans aurantiacus]GMA32697.1 hypothetical protein GCM10025875_26890 [Litorihabitans aurantiacus]